MRLLFAVSGRIGDRTGKRKAGERTDMRRAVPVGYGGERLPASG